MKCSSCGKEIPDGSKFCTYCGTKCEAKITCPECNALVDSNLRFCPFCGAKISDGENDVDDVTSEEKETQVVTNNPEAPVPGDKSFETSEVVSENTANNSETLSHNSFAQTAGHSGNQDNYQETRQSNQQNNVMDVAASKVPFWKKLTKNQRIGIIASVVGICILAGVVIGISSNKKNIANTSKPNVSQSYQSNSKQKKHSDSELSLDSVFIGENWSDVQRDLGQPNSSSQEPPNYTRHKYDDMEVVVENKNNTVQALVSENSSVSTKRGIHQGDSLSDVLKAYGTDYKKSDYGEQTYYEYGYKTKDGSPALLRFAINSNDKVDYISIRTITNDVNNAKKAFLDYYKAISNHRFKDAYSYFTDNGRQSVGDYSSYARGYQDTLSSTVSNISVVDSSPSKVTFTYTLKSRDRVPVSSKNKIQTFSGEVTMINDNGKWYIDNMNAHKTDEHIE